MKRKIKTFSIFSLFYNRKVFKRTQNDIPPYHHNWKKWRKDFKVNNLCLSDDLDFCPLPNSCLCSLMMNFTKFRRFLSGKNNLFISKIVNFWFKFIPTIVTTAHQNASGIDLKKELSLPASAKYTADEKRTTPGSKIFYG